MSQATAETMRWMYETMLFIRRYEETMAQVYLEGKLPPHIQKGLAFDIASGPVPGEMHLAAGQEPVAVGVCAHLTDRDTVVGTHRPHHFAIAEGGMTAGICGACIPPACGAALAAKMLGTQDVAVAFFGEGAANQGTFHESRRRAVLSRASKCQRVSISRAGSPSPR